MVTDVEREMKRTDLANADILYNQGRISYDEYINELKEIEETYKDIEL